MTEVTPIRPDVIPLTKEPNPEAIEMLRKLLEQAETGKLQVFAFAAVNNDGDAAIDHTEHVSMGLIGALQILINGISMSFNSRGTGL